ncbi:hypothetical protein LTR49_025123 [Elasticomyces elasticus]|nr:hypothetical protein LTR49_025123 [Elasticomyces elasticus]
MVAVQTNAPNEDYVNRFVNNVPSTDQWRSRQIEWQLTDAEACRSFVRQCLAPESLEAGDGTQVQPINTLEDLARDLGKSTLDRWQLYQVHKRQVHVRVLVLLSFFHVLGKTHCFEELDPHIRWISGREVDRKAMVRSIGDLHSAARALVQTGWSEQRVAELFILCAPAPGMYKRLSKRWDDVMGRIKSRDPDRSPHGPGPCFFPFTLLDLVLEALDLFKVRDDLLSASDVRRHLGYGVETYSPLTLILAPDVGRDQPLEVILEEGNPRSTEPDIASQTSHQSVRGQKRSFEDGGKPTMTKAARHNRQQVTPGRCVSNPPPPTNLLWQNVMLIPGPNNSASDDLSDAFGRIFLNLRCQELPEEVLDRGITPCRYWTENGDAAERRLRDSGASAQCTTLFGDTTTLRSAIEMCVRGGLIKISEPTRDGRRVLHRTRTLASSHTNSAYVLDALRLITHVFPLDEALERRSGQIVKQLVPVLRGWAPTLSDPDWCDREKMPRSLREALIEIFTAASARQRDCGLLDVAEKLTFADLPRHLLLAIAKLRSLFARREGRLEESDRIVDEALIGIDQSGSTRLKCLAIELRLSKAENLILPHKHKDALDVALHARLVDHGHRSDKEWIALRKAQMVCGRAYRYMGDFKSAEETFRVCRQFSQSRSDIGLPHVKRHLADVWNEMGRPLEAEELLNDELLQCPSTIVSHRRLQLSYGSVLLATDRTEEARSLFEAVGTHFQEIKPKDQTDELDHLHAKFKLMVVSRRVQEWNHLVKLAGQTLNLLDSYASFPKQDYYAGRALKYRSGAYLELAREDDFNAKHCESIRRHFIVHVGTSEHTEQDEWLTSLETSCICRRLAD